MRPGKPAFIVLLLFFIIDAKSQRLDTLLQINTGTLHFKILKGNRTPILFESGGGLDASQWDSIATTLHKLLDATIITYDRAGFGQSSLDTVNYTILREVEHMEIGLARLGYDSTHVILVGHSLGGFYNRLFAARNPDKTMGIILLDPRIPSLKDVRFARNYFQSLDRDDFIPEHLNFYHLLANIENNSNYLRQIPLPKHIPILNLMAEKGPFLSPKENSRFQAAQRKLVRKNSNRRLQVVRNSSHNIPQDKPDIVTNEIEAFYRNLHP